MAGRHSAVPVVPGYRTERLLGFGADGEVWAAVDEDDGSLVALKVLARPGEDERVLRETALLRRVDHPHVVRLRAVTRVPGLGPVMVLDRAVGGSLGALVGARGPLDVGETVTVLTPLAGALADLHDLGLVHGDVSPGNVLFDERGRPLLADLGVASIVGEGSDGDVSGTPGYADPARLAGAPPSPAGDVHGLAAVAWLALTGRAPAPAGERPPLVAVAPHVPTDLCLLLEEALDADPSRRPTARRLAARCFDTAAAEPVRLVPTDPAAAPAEVVTHRLRAAAAAPTPPAPRARRPRLPTLPASHRPTALAGAAALVLVVAGTFGVPRLLSADAPATGARPVAGGAVGSAEAPGDAVPAAVEAALQGEDPEAAVPALAWLRARAFTTGEPALLQRASTPGGPALDSDLERLRELRTGGVRLAGLGFDVQATELVSRDGDAAVVDTTVVTLAHRQVHDSGQVLAVLPPGEARTSRLVLVRGTDGWQVDRVG